MTRRRSRKHHSSDSDAISSRKSSAKISMGFRVNVSMTTSENRPFQLAPPPKPLPPLSNRSKRNSYNKSIRLNKLEPPPSLPPSIFGPNGSSLLRYSSPHVLNRHHQKRRTNNDSRRGRRYSSNSYELMESRKHSTMNPSYKMAYQPPNMASQLPSGAPYAHVQFKSQNQQFWPHPTTAAAYPLPTGYNLSNATSKHIVGSSSSGATKSSIKERKVISSKSKKSRKRSCSTCSTYSSSSCSVSSTCSTCCSRQSSSRSTSTISSDRSYRRHRRHRKTKVQKPKRRRATVKKRKSRSSKKRHTRTKAKRRQLTESSICSESESNHTPTIASNAASCAGIIEEQTDDKQKQPRSEDESYTTKSDDASVTDTNKQIEYDDDEDLRDLAEKKRILLEQIAQLDAQLCSPTEVDEYCDNQAINSTEIIE